MTDNPNKKYYELYCETADDGCNMRAIDAVVAVVREDQDRYAAQMNDELGYARGRRDAARDIVQWMRASAAEDECTCSKCVEEMFCD